jgi:type IV pilus assembly protein PilM
MAFKKSAVAIDLGSHAVRVLEVSVSEKGVHVHRALSIARSELAEEGIEPGDHAGLASALRSRMAEARISPRGVVLGIGGQDSMMRYTRIPPVPAWRLKVIMDYEVNEVAEKIGEPLASDYRVLELPREADEDQTILMGLAKETPLQAILDAFEAVRITAHRAVPNPLAVYAACDAFWPKPDPDAPEDDLLLAADMGAENLNIAILLNGRLAFARSTSFGGRHFTDALATGLNLKPEDAEKLKIGRGGLDDREKGVFYDSVPLLRTAAGQLLGMLQSSLRFAATQTGARLPPVSRIVLMGGGMRLRGLQAFLGQGLGCDAEEFRPTAMKLDPDLPEDVAGAIASRPGELGVALGLGASSLREAGASESEKRTLSLLPAKYRKRRELRDRTAYLYAAAALLIVLLLARFAQGIAGYSKARDVHAELSSTHTQLTGMKAELDQTASQAEVRRARLNHLLREAEVTSFQAYVLDLLPRVLRPEVQLEKVWLEVAEDEDSGQRDYRLHIAGRANNEKSQGLDCILDLQSALKAEERIGSVEEESSRPQGAWYTFELSVRPNYVAY